MRTPGVPGVRADDDAPMMPVWKKLRGVAHALPNDYARAGSTRRVSRCRSASSSDTYDASARWVEGSRAE